MYFKCQNITLIYCKVSKYNFASKSIMCIFGQCISNHLFAITANNNLMNSMYSIVPFGESKCPAGVGLMAVLATGGGIAGGSAPRTHSLATIQ
jgi:hypothetical protein